MLDFGSNPLFPIPIIFYSSMSLSGSSLFIIENMLNIGFLELLELMSLIILKKWSLLLRSRFSIFNNRFFPAYCLVYPFFDWFSFGSSLLSEWWDIKSSKNPVRKLFFGGYSFLLISYFLEKAIRTFYEFLFI